MGITVIWDDDAHTTIRTIYEGAWSWDEYQTAGVQVGMMLSSVPHRIDGIIDIRSSRYVPPGYLEQMRAIQQGSPIPHMGILVIIGEHLAYEMFNAFVQQEGPVFFSYAYAHSIEIARQIIAAARAGQSWGSDDPPPTPGAN